MNGPLGYFIFNLGPNITESGNGAHKIPRLEELLESGRDAGIISSYLQEDSPSLKLIKRRTTIPRRRQSAHKLGHCVKLKLFSD